MFFIAWLRFFSPPLEALYSWLHIQDQACPQKGHSHFLAFAGIAYLYQTDSKNGLNFPLFEWNVNECALVLHSEEFSLKFHQPDSTIYRNWWNNLQRLNSAWNQWFERLVWTVHFTSIFRWGEKCRNFRIVLIIFILLKHRFTIENYNNCECVNDLWTWQVFKGHD